MKISLSSQEAQLLISAGIQYDPSKEYDDDAAFSLLDAVRDQEVFHVQNSAASEEDRKLAIEHARLADKIQSQIPEE